MDEPARDKDLSHLDPNFRAKLESLLETMHRVHGVPFKVSEGFRTVQRQAWLFGQGRTGVPYGREGKRVTNANGRTVYSNHQGTGTVGTGRAADCYPMNVETGKIIWPPPPDDDPIWNTYATEAEKLGLTSGYRWRSPHDPPHVELRVH